VAATDRPSADAGYRIAGISSSNSGVRDVDHSARLLNCDIRPNHDLCGERETSSDR
jgi:hypothetical protein